MCGRRHRRAERTFRRFNRCSGDSSYNCGQGSPPLDRGLPALVRRDFVPSELPRAPAATIVAHGLRLSAETVGRSHPGPMAEADPVHLRRTEVLGVINAVSYPAVSMCSANGQEARRCGAMAIGDATLRQWGRGVRSLTSGVPNVRVMSASTVLSAVARERLGPLGLVQRGRSRTWVDDQGW